MTARRHGKRWPALVLERIGDEPAFIKAGALGRGRYVAIDVCGQPINFRYLDDPVVCQRCRREYVVREESS